MSSISLLERLRFFAPVDKSRVALVTGSSITTFEELCAIQIRYDQPRLGISFADPASATAALLSADGFAESMTLLPDPTSASEIERLSKQVGFRVIASSSDDEVLDSNKTEVLSTMNFDSTTYREVPRAQQQETEWLILTSGTTGVPKLVRHTSTGLASRVTTEETRSKDNAVWGHFYDLARFAGIQVMFQSVFSGRTLVIPPRNLPFLDQVDFLLAHGVSHLSASPTLWRKILMAPNSDQLPLQQITLGGEAADQRVLSALRKRYPTARITHVYASTEAGIGFSVSDGLAGFPKAFLKRKEGKPEIEVRGDRLWFRPQVTGLGYLDGGRVGADGWVNTEDLVEFEDDRFFVVGRGNQILNIGGDKVVTEQVRLAILESEMVSDAIVFGRSNPIIGSIVCADIMLAHGVSQEKARDELDRFLKSRLSEMQRPRIMRFVDQVSVNSAGKAVAGER